MLFALRQIQLLSDDSFTNLVNAFQETPLSLTLEGYTSRVQTKAQLGLPVIRAIVDAVGILQWELRGRGLSTSEVVDTVRRALDDAEPDESLREGYRNDTFKQRLVTLLELNQSLNLELKIGRLIYEQERSVQEMRIVTELRPIFRDDVDDVPVGNIALHNLRLSYFQDGEQKSFFVTLDSDDIIKLRAQLNRAEEKEASLRKALETTVMPILTEDTND